MAVATAFTPINMNNWTIWYGDATVADSTHIRVVSGGRVQDYFGSFSYDPNDGALTGGTVSSTTYTLNGVQQYIVTGMNHSVLQINNLGDAGNAQNLLGYILSGNDVMNGSSGADAVNGYAGNDKINGGLGADKINGGAGSDTITWGDGDTVNGGVGKDILKVSAALLDLTTLANNKIVNVETINLAGTTTLRLNLQDLLAFPGDDLKVTGDAADTVDFDGTLGAGTAEGTFTRYSLGGGASLLIDSDIDVI
jgi:Ca2+-binding RTX toxin-like protein